MALLNGAPWIGGVISSWISQNRQKVMFQRINECLIAVHNKLEEIDFKIDDLNKDQDFIDSTVSVLERVSKTISERKRLYFSNLIANSALVKNFEEREEMLSMSLLLDQLEFIHVITLNKIMLMPYSQSVMVFGPERTVNISSIKEFSGKERFAMGMLQELGLIDLSGIRQNLNNSGAIKISYSGDIKITSRCIKFYEWISDPQKEN